MRVLKNDVGRPSNKTIMIRTILKGICLIILLAAAVAAGYYLNDYQKKDSAKKTENKKEVEKKLSDKEAYNIVIDVFGKNAVATFHYLEPKYINTDSFKTFAVITNTIANKKYVSCKKYFGDDLEQWGGAVDGKSWAVPIGEDHDGFLCYDDTQEVYEYSEVNQKYKKSFGETKNAYKGYAENPYGGGYMYSKSEDSYVWLSCECGGDDVLAFVDGFTDATLKGNTLTISYNILTDSDNDDYFEFKDGSKIDVDQVVNSEDSFERCKDSTKTAYKLIFEKTDNGYVFKEAK